ncbi:hypothetical protein AC1031_001458 [Aphanomyces cochlioides]|nr:hypothetical protein AC1031_001458 [Aphanomyces cochlioides]
MSSEGSTTAPTGRRKWTVFEDLILLRQVLQDVPFTKKGELMKAWTDLASALRSCENFNRKVDEKAVQNRFLTLIQHHRDFNREAAKLSGASEDIKEKTQLLDDLVCLYDDFKAEQASKTMKEAKVKANNENATRLIREKAMQTLSKRSSESKDDTPSKTDTDAELEKHRENLALKQQKFEAEMRERELDREERRLEREH